MAGMFKAINKEDIEREFESMLDDGVRPTVKMISKKLGYSQWHISKNFPKRFGMKYTEFSQEMFFVRIEQMHAEGMSYYDIAAFFNLDRSSISLALSRFKRKGHKL